MNTFIYSLARHPAIQSLITHHAKLRTSRAEATLQEMRDLIRITSSGHNAVCGGIIARLKTLANYAGLPWPRHAAGESPSTQLTIINKWLADVTHPNQSPNYSLDTEAVVSALSDAILRDKSVFWIGFDAQKMTIESSVVKAVGYTDSESATLQFRITVEPRPNCATTISVTEYIGGRTPSLNMEEVKTGDKLAFGDLVLRFDHIEDGKAVCQLNTLIWGRPAYQRFPLSGAANCLRLTD